MCYAGVHYKHSVKLKRLAKGSGIPSVKGHNVHSVLYTNTLAAAKWTQCEPAIVIAINGHAITNMHCTAIGIHVFFIQFV